VAVVATPAQTKRRPSSPRIIASACSTSCIVSGRSRPIGRSSRARETARTPRQIAALSSSMPSAGEILGRSNDGARELDTGTTTNSSCSTPAAISSTETTIAGRFFPGSPLRAAPSETSQISPRRGSADAIAKRGLPRPLLAERLTARRVSTRRVALRAEHSLPRHVARQLSQHRRQRHPSLTRLLGKQVAGLARHANRRGIDSHSHSIAPIRGDNTERPAGRSRSESDGPDGRSQSFDIVEARYAPSAPGGRSNRAGGSSGLSGGSGRSTPGGISTCAAWR
jgi:hypothetical protein